jgi:hypothetical protein
MGRKPLSPAIGAAVNPFTRLREYTDNADTRAAACNSIALIVASNQPIYPFYVAYFVGGDAWAACWTFLSTPLFWSVPWFSRRNPLAGRALLVLAGVANTIVSTKAFGAASRVELFLVPCALIGALAFRRSEVLWAVALIALCAATALLHPLYGASFGQFSATDLEGFARLNGYSLLTLSLFILWRLGSATLDERRSGSSPNTPPSPRLR